MWEVFLFFIFVEHVIWGWSSITCAMQESENTMNNMNKWFFFLWYQNLGERPWFKVHEANSVSFLFIHLFWFLIYSIFVLILWVSSTWWFSQHIDDCWVSHLCKHLTTPTILHDEECYPPSYDTLNFCGRGTKIRG